MDLKMHLSTVAPFVKMAEKTTMCLCESRGVPATRMLSRLIREVQLYLQQHAKGSVTSSRMEDSLLSTCVFSALRRIGRSCWPFGTTCCPSISSSCLGQGARVEQVPKTGVRVDFRQGLDPSMALDFLETCAAHGVGVQKDLEELCQLLRCCPAVRSDFE